jgi:5-hydroxyisourate hydrolase
MKITAQALDGVYGRSASGVPARLERSESGSWRVVARATTDADGCIRKWQDQKLNPGVYRIVFDSDHYFASLGLVAIYPEVTTMFRMLDEINSCQIHVLLSPYCYSTYFGSHS